MTQSPHHVPPEQQPPTEQPTAVPKAAPAINLPPMTMILVLLPLAVHLLRAVWPLADQYLYAVFVFMPGAFIHQGPLSWVDWTGFFGYWLLHASALHVIMNVVMIAVFGRLLEQYFGPVTLLLLFLLSVIGAGLAAIGLATVPNAGLVGASGGAMGLTAAVIGLYIAWPPARRQAAAPLLRLALFVVVLNVVLPASGIMELAGKLVSWQGHLGGALTGGIIAWMLEKSRLSKSGGEPL